MQCYPFCAVYASYTCFYSCRMSDLKNKVVIITGASGGIGCATAVEFARVGAKLCITGRNEQRLNETKLKCKEAGLSENDVLPVIADVTEQEDIEKIITQTIHKFKHIDVLINNAGRPQKGSFQEIDSEILDNLYHVNVKSLFCLSKATLPHLILSKGNIVNISSIAGLRPMPASFAYSASKAMVDHMTQMMALELGPNGVRVNSVNPAVIKTDIFIKPGGTMSDAPERLSEFYASIATAHPLQRVGEPEEVARTILFLASESASFISGALVPVDGARSCTSAAPVIKIAA